MKIDIENLVEQGFIVKENKIGNEEVLLIIQGQHPKWTLDNLKYRSSVWRKSDGHPISLSYKKFFNWGEQSTLIPEPEDITGTLAVEKIDGSTLIASTYNNELILRTRGTVDATTLENGHEIPYLIKSNPKAFDNNIVNGGNHTVIFEWTSPINKIVLDYGSKPLIFLTGIINHEDYTMLDQKQLDEYGKKWDVRRPIYYQFDNIVSMIDNIKALKGQEGVCLYYNNQQYIKKIKSLDYLAKHTFKSNLSVDSILDIYIKYGLPNYHTFLANIEGDFDFECMEMSRDIVSKVIDGKRQIDKIIAHALKFVEPLKVITRKDAAEQIISSYGKTSRAGMLFKLLDGKELSNDDIKKLLYQMLKGRGI